MASGTTPPPTLIGAYCALEPSETEGIPIFIDELLRRYF